MKKFSNKSLIGLSLAATLVFALPKPAWAAQWLINEAGFWQYEDNGIKQTGWQQIDDSWYYFDEQGNMATGWVHCSDLNHWYYLDEVTGKWLPKPALTQEGACHLLENALVESGLYQNEEHSLEYKVEYSDKSIIRISIGYEKLPSIFQTINTYEITKSSRTARSVLKDQVYQL